ncbi:HD-like signal output (HDOD) domain, no enzymatic activity [Vibrio xiamenensis]|uniref:HD-like signal output (HDOD) domain, no enzymatic activity n=1 Tax=Vibrio xiamenensis TaxID=861298 RepID=A0A1G7XFB6_9VIBR|nr:HDOD domain-containing protein [Vibrio xiamenensis]SDG82968.1 HD-like signal output (HDOD) domain, no enzymatic activity [Vibrio xiamenensis]
MNHAPLISRLNELPRIQKILQELLELVNQDEVDFKLLAQKLSMDQVLSARLLRMANSAHFGGNKTVTSVNEALIRVGSGPVKTLVVASVLSSAFPNIETLDMEQYWSDTFEISVISSQIARAVKMDVDEVFTTGVLHNIGELMIHTLEPEKALIINSKVLGGQDIISAQEDVLDVCGATLGAILAKSWKFPDEMVDAIEHYPDPRDADISPKLAAILHFAKDIHSKWDDFATDKDKALYLAEHADSRLLSVSATFAQTIDAHRGHGRELAKQMLAA